MASGNRRWHDRGRTPTSGRMLRAVALALLVFLAPVGSIGDYASAETPTIEVADGSFPRSDVHPTGTIEKLHAAGITGDNVSVGVLDVTGYDAGNPALSGNVAASKSFGPGQGVPNLGRNAHGTATASIVASVAPDAELYLASFSSQESYHEAFDWLIASNVDVIVVPVSFYGQPRDGDANVSDPVRRASRAGTTVVTAAGNIGESHWSGPFQHDSRGRLQFEGDVKNGIRGNRSRLVLWLSWEQNADADFALELYRTGRSERVAVSSNFTGDTARNERLVATIDPRASYYFVVRGPPVMTQPRVTVESPTHRFEHARRHGSITQPGVHDDSITVGAYDVAQGSSPAYSSGGPVDSNPGVDVLAPTDLVAPGYPKGFEGTSSSAAYVGGLAALIHDVDPDTQPGHVESLLERTARDVGRPGPDTLNGYGVVEPDALIRLARNESTARRTPDNGS